MKVVKNKCITFALDDDYGDCDTSELFESSFKMLEIFLFGPDNKPKSAQELVFAMEDLLSQDNVSCILAIIILKFNDLRDFKIYRIMDIISDEFISDDKTTKKLYKKLSQLYN